MGKYKHPASVSILEEAIRYEAQKEELWRLPIPELKVIGEYTTPNGPYVDDYFFVFLSAHNWYEASLYAQGSLELLPVLSDILKNELACGLQNSTDWKSRVIWPPDIKGEVLFDVVPARMPNRLWEKMKHRLMSPVDFRLTFKVREKMRECTSSEASSSNDLR